MKILAVDDDPTILEMLRHCLTRQDDFELVCTDTAEGAFDALAESNVPFDCFLLDIMLPGVDGIELCGHIRALKDHKTTPIIMITGSRRHDLMENAFRAGATDFIFKPLNGVELGARINTAGMLNESLRRERETHHMLSELTSLMKIRREEGFDLGVRDVHDLNGFENRLLRLPEGCYAMNLVAIKLPLVRNIFDAMTPAEFCRQMVRVAEATVSALSQVRCIIGYGGNGTIVAAIMSRSRIDPAKIQKRIEVALTEGSMTSRGGQNIAADVSVSLVSNRRLWSGLSACNALHDFLNKDLSATDNVLSEDEPGFVFDI